MRTVPVALLRHRSAPPKTFRKSGDRLSPLFRWFPAGGRRGATSVARDFRAGITQLTEFAGWIFSTIDPLRARLHPPHPRQEVLLSDNTPEFKGISKKRPGWHIP